MDKMLGWCEATSLHVRWKAEFWLQLKFEAKAPVVVSGLLFGKMAISADISLHHKRRRDVSGDTQQRQSH
jgi:hypothetical protein